MADWSAAFNFMMDSEDASHSYKQVSDAAPAGCPGPCYAIAGINSGAWPKEFAAIAATPQDQRGPLVEQFYRDHFWNDWFAQLASDEVAKRVFDFAVNGGAKGAVRCLQQSVNGLSGAGIAEDGGWGPATLHAANLCDGEQLAARFRSVRADHYRAIIAAHPEDTKYLRTWLARAEK